MSSTGVENPTMEWPAASFFMVIMSVVTRLPSRAWTTPILDTECILDHRRISVRSDFAVIADQLMVVDKSRQIERTSAVITLSHSLQIRL